MFSRCSVDNWSWSLLRRMFCGYLPTPPPPCAQQIRESLTIQIGSFGCRGARFKRPLHKTYWVFIVGLSANNIPRLLLAWHVTQANSAKAIMSVSSTIWLDRPCLPNPNARGAVRIVSARVSCALHKTSAIIGPWSSVDEYFIEANLSLSRESCKQLLNI